MVANYSDATKLKQAQLIAKEGKCFVVERSEFIQGKTGGMVRRFYWILYREDWPRNFYIGKRTTIDGLLTMVRAATSENAVRTQEKFAWAK